MAVTRQNIQRLYTQYLRASNTFESYNFKQYFIRRSEHKFRVELPQALGIDQTKYDFTSQEASSSSEPVVSDAEKSQKLDSWYQNALDELAVLKRSSTMNAMYQAPSLVVEGRGKLLDNKIEGTSSSQS